MADEQILYRVDDGVAYITISNEARANCLTYPMIGALASAWARAADDDVRLAVLTGSGAGISVLVPTAASCRRWISPSSRGSGTTRRP